MLVATAEDPGATGLPVHHPFGLFWHLWEGREWMSQEAMMFSHPHSHSVWRMVTALVDA